MSNSDRPRESGRIPVHQLQGEVCGFLCAGWTPEENEPHASRGSRSPTPMEWGDSEWDFWRVQGSLWAQQLARGQLDFNLGLPDDEETLETRVKALACWLGGFLSTLGEVGSGFPKTREGREVLRDLVEISRVDPPPVATENDERDFLEVAEYVRMAVQFLYDERRGATAPPVSEESPHEPP